MYSIQDSGLGSYMVQKNLELRPIIDSSDVAKVEKLSEPEFKHHAESTGILRVFFPPGFLGMQW